MANRARPLPSSAWLPAACAAALMTAHAAGHSDDDVELARSCQIARLFEFADGGDEKAQQAEDPVLNYSDPARMLSHATCWLWTSEGRAIGALAIEFNPSGEGQGHWTFEGVTLRSGDSVLQLGESQWPLNLPPGSALSLTGVGEPARDRPARLTQLKLLARRFSAVSLSQEEGRNSLRLLPRPVYRYPDDASGVVDGAVFAFTYGTNPEVLLAIEAVERDDRIEWSYRLAPLTAGRLSISLGDEEVWSQQPYTGPGSRTNYVNGPVEVGDEFRQIQQVRAAESGNS